MFNNVKMCIFYKKLNDVKIIKEIGLTDIVMDKQVYEQIKELF